MRLDLFLALLKSPSYSSWEAIKNMQPQSSRRVKPISEITR